jgi:phospholipid transport system substrate-binding protein
MLPVATGLPTTGMGRRLVMSWYPRFRWRTLAALAFLLAGSQVFTSSVSPAATPGPSPTEVIRNFYGELLDTMQHAAALGVKGRYRKLDPVIFRTCDVPFMAKLTIGPVWAGLAPDKKQQAARAYGRYITAVYASRFDGYSGERFEVLGERKITHGVMIRTRIIKSDGEPVTIDYRVHDNAVGWQIRDVYETGSISELATQRSDFAGILRASGIDGLIAALNKKANDLQR